MSDLLGDNSLYGSVSSFQGRRLGSIVSNLSGTAIYLNRSRRRQLGPRRLPDQGSKLRGRQRRGLRGDGVWRASACSATRSRDSPVLEGTMMVERSDRTDFTLEVDEPRRIGWIASHYLSYVRDNALWIPSGPIDGGRVSLTAGVSSDFTNSRFDSYLVSGDWRKYFRLGGQSAWALRAFGYYSGGDRPRRINIGGTVALRGYPQFGYIVGSRAFMFNQELRFPTSHSSHPGHPFRRSRSSGNSGRTLYRRRSGLVFHLDDQSATRQLRD